MPKSTQPDLNDAIPLAKVVEALRAEIQALNDKVDNEAIRFGVKDIEIEFNTVVSRDTEANGGVKVAILNASAKAHYKAQQIHKVNIKLSAKDAQGNTLDCAGEVDSDLADLE